VRKQLYDFSYYGKWCHLQVKAFKHGRDAQLVCDSHEQIFDTAATNRSRISWFKSSNSQVGISCETSSCILHPLLSSASARVASIERVRCCIWAVLYIHTRKHLLTLERSLVWHPFAPKYSIIKRGECSRVNWILSFFIGNYSTANKCSLVCKCEVVPGRYCTCKGEWFSFQKLI